MSILGDAEDFECLIEDTGNTIQIEEITDTSFNKYGDATETTGTISGIKAICQYLTFEDRMVQEGLYRSGDVIFYIPVTEQTTCGVKQKNKIIFQFQYFEIMEVIPHIQDDELFVYEVRGKRI